MVGETPIFFGLKTLYYSREYVWDEKNGVSKSKFVSR